MEPINNEEKIEELVEDTAVEVSEEADVVEAAEEAGPVETTDESDSVEATETEESDGVENTEISEEVSTVDNAETSEKEAVVETEEDALEETENEEDSAEDDEYYEETEADIKKKKIKIAIIAVFAFIVLCAAIYVAAVMGGKNNNIPVEIEEEVPVEEAVKEKPQNTVTYVEVETEVEDEEPAEESMLMLLPGNRNYDQCLYADGGVVIVNTAGKYGAMDYDGKELVKCSYDACYEYPTDEGYFVLSNSKVETKTEEKDGTTLSYETETTTYTLFDNTGKALYTGNNAVKQTGNMYMLGIEEDDITKSRIEYYLLEGKNKPVLTLYTTEPKNLNAFRDGNITVMGYNMPTSAEDEKGVRDIKCGSMDEKGKVTWFAIAPGVMEFDREYQAWEKENKNISAKADTKKKKTDAAVEDENELEEDALDESDEEVEDDEDSADTDVDSEDIEKDSEDEEKEDEEVVDESITGGPQYTILNILNSIHDGYFVYRDIYSSDSVLSFYTIKGEWFANIDPKKMKSDDAKGFVIGDMDKKVDILPYSSDGQLVYNYGPMMVLVIGKNSILIDVSKVKGMTSDTMSDAIIVGVYEEVRLSDSEHWVIKKNGKYNYIDHNAKEMKFTFEDASDFKDGYALVVKDGVAKIINEEFEELEDIGKAQNVYITGDIMHTVVDGKVKNYILKERKENPLGVENKDGKN